MLYWSRCCSDTLKFSSSLLSSASKAFSSSESSLELRVVGRGIFCVARNFYNFFFFEAIWTWKLFLIAFLLLLFVANFGLFSNITEPVCLCVVEKKKKESWLSWQQGLRVCVSLMNEFRMNVNVSDLRLLQINVFLFDLSLFLDKTTQDQKLKKGFWIFWIE